MTTRLYCVLVSILLVTTVASSTSMINEDKKILLAPLPALSHIAFQMDIAAELTRRNFSVAVALPSNFQEFVGKYSSGHVRFLDLGPFSVCEEYMSMITSTQDVAESLFWSSLQADRMNKALTGSVKTVMTEENPNVVVADNFFQLAHHIASEIGIPVIKVHTLVKQGDLLNWHDDLDLSLVARLQRLWMIVRVVVTGYITLRWHGIDIDELYPNPLMPSLFGIHISFPGYNFPFKFQHPPTHVFVGFPTPQINQILTRPEDKQLKSFLDSLSIESQVIYVAFGSLVKVNITIFNSVVQGVLNSSKDTYVVLSWPKFQSFPDHWPSDRVRVEKWTNQMMVLRHNRTKLFVTHGGTRSLGEAVVTHTPVLVLPQFGDQPVNALLATRAGYALSIKRPSDITAGNIEKSLSNMLSNYSKFVAAIKVVDKLRQLAGGMRRAGDLIESVLVGGEDRFKPVDWESPMWVTHSLDIAGMALLLLIVILVLTWWLMRSCCRVASQCLKPHKEKKQ